MTEIEIMVVNRQRHGDLVKREGKVLAGSRAELTVLGKTAPVRADKLLVLDLRGIEFIWVLFHAVVCYL